MQSWNTGGRRHILPDPRHRAGLAVVGAARHVEAELAVCVGPNSHHHQTLVTDAAQTVAAAVICYYNCRGARLGFDRGGDDGRGCRTSAIALLSRVDDKF